MKETTGEAEDPPRSVRDMTERVTADGGSVLAAFREPVGGHWHLFCLLPLEKVAPTPYQRDLSPTHVKRLHDAVKKIDRFVDPIVVVSPEPGVYWTPNGHHRLKVLQKLKADTVPGLAPPGGGGRLPDPRPQHREGPQPQGEIAGGHPHVPRAGGVAAEEGRGGLHLPVRGAPPRHPRPPLRAEQALRGRGVRSPAAPGRRLPAPARSRVRCPSAKRARRRSAPPMPPSWTWWPSSRSAASATRS